ncbi:IS3 family transposase [Crenobacter oryzisoli]|uniref:IS3 family transposase n=1 Tax=Crenobacter oryzisoli TaxID=3056844 RepID=UPI00338E751F
MTSLVCELGRGFRIPSVVRYSQQSLCCVLSVSTSGFADWKAGGGTAQWLSDAQLLGLIRSVHAEFNGAYVSPRIYQELKFRGLPVSKARIRRLM